MAGVNLIRALELSEEVPLLEEGGESASLGFSRGRRITIGGLDWNDLPASHKFKILTFIGGVLGVFLSQSYLTNTYLPEQLIGPETELADIDQRIQVASQRKAQFKDLEAELVENEKRIGEVKRKIDLINETKQAGRDRILRMVDFAINQVPEPVWLTSVQIKAQAGSEVELQGFSVNYQSITSFYSRLEAGAYFANWQLLDSQKENAKLDGKDTEANSFTLKANVVNLQ